MTLKNAWDGKDNTEFGKARALMPWLFASASSLINKLTVDTDGETAHERCRGRNFKTLI